MGSGRGTSKKRNQVVEGLRLMGKKVCKKCGRPISDIPTGGCIDFPKCKQVTIRRLVGRAYLDPKY